MFEESAGLTDIYCIAYIIYVKYSLDLLQKISNYSCRNLEFTYIEFEYKLIELFEALC